MIHPFECLEHLPPGTLSVEGPETCWQQVVSVLDRVYPYEVYTHHFADGRVHFALDVPFPVGFVYTQLSFLASLGVSGGWFSWNEAQPYSYLPEDEQWVF